MFSMDAAGRARRGRCGGDRGDLGRAPDGLHRISVIDRLLLCVADAAVGVLQNGQVEPFCRRIVDRRLVVRVRSAISSTRAPGTRPRRTLRWPPPTARPSLRSASRDAFTSLTTTGSLPGAAHPSIKLTSGYIAVMRDLHCDGVAVRLTGGETARVRVRRLRRRRGSSSPI